LKGTTQFQGWVLGLASTTYYDNKAIRIVGSLEAKSIVHCETNKCCGFPIWVSRFSKNPSCLSCSLLEPYLGSTILGKIHDPLRPIEINGEHEYEVEDILDQGFLIVNSNILFIGMGIMWMNALGNQ
jgi:hypothetical protein